VPVIFSRKATPVESQLLAQAALRPNPFGAQCELVNVANLDELTILAANGAVVRIVKHNGAETLTVDTHALPEGFYLFQLRDNEGHYRTLRAVRR